MSSTYSNAIISAVNQIIQKIGNTSLSTVTTCPTGTLNDMNTSCDSSLNFAASEGNTTTDGYYATYDVIVNSISNSLDFAITTPISSEEFTETTITYTNSFTGTYLNNISSSGDAINCSGSVYTPEFSVPEICWLDECVPGYTIPSSYPVISIDIPDISWTVTVNNGTVTGDISYTVSVSQPSTSQPIETINVSYYFGGIPVYIYNLEITDLTIDYGSLALYTNITFGYPVLVSNYWASKIINEIFKNFSGYIDMELSDKVYLIVGLSEDPNSVVTGSIYPYIVDRNTDFISPNYYNSVLAMNGGISPNGSEYFGFYNICNIILSPSDSGLYAINNNNLILTSSSGVSTTVPRIIIGSPYYVNTDSSIGMKGSQYLGVYSILNTAFVSGSFGSYNTFDNEVQFYGTEDPKHSSINLAINRVNIILVKAPYSVNASNGTIVYMYSAGYNGKYSLTSTSLTPGSNGYYILSGSNVIFTETTRTSDDQSTIPIVDIIETITIPSVDIINIPIIGYSYIVDHFNESYVLMNGGGYLGTYDVNTYILDPNPNVANFGTYVISGENVIFTSSLDVVYTISSSNITKIN